MQIIAQPKFKLKCMRHYLDNIHLSSEDRRIQQKGANETIFIGLFSFHDMSEPASFSLPASI